jgi:hypothetical protein
MMVQAFAQQSASPCEQKDQKFAAVVMAPVVGTCQLRDHENAQPQPVKAGQPVRADQALQCRRGSHLRIQFCNSKAEREISQNAPNWYVVPNVPKVNDPSGLVAAIRTVYHYCDWCPPYQIYYYTDIVALKEIALWKLYQTKEAKALGEAMSDDFYASYPDGQKLSKTRFLEDMSTITLKDYLWSQVRVVTKEESKTLSYVVFAHLSKGGEESSVLIKVTSSWILRNGHWYIVSHEQKNL